MTPKQQGFTDEEIAEVTAHESVKTTQGYQNPDDFISQNTR